MKDSPEAAKMIYRAQHAEAVRPQVNEISRTIRWRRRLPLGLYLAATLICMGIIWYCETVNPTPL